MDLRQYMRVQNITIQKMANALGISTGTMHNIFNGRDPKLSLAMKIEEFTNSEVTCEDLLSRVKNKDREEDDEQD